MHIRFLGTLLLAMIAIPALAQEEEKTLGWSNVADLGFVLTSGNSSTSTFAFDNKTTRAWENAELGFRFGALRTETTDDRFAQGTENDFEIIDPERNLDNERFYVIGQYQRNISDRFFWLTGAGWDKDKNAGIDNRTVLFAGVGNTWKDVDVHKFKTDYTITFTKRVDVITDPMRDENFSELRLSADYMKKLNTSNQFDSDTIFFTNLSEVGDYRFDTMNSLTTNLNSVIALRFSVQLLYQNQPALEEIELVNDIGLGTGVVIVRKKALDTITKFSLVVTF